MGGQVKFGLILHWFKGHNHSREKEENKASKERKLALGLVHTARARGWVEGKVKRHFKARSKNRSAVSCPEDRHPVPTA